MSLTIQRRQAWVDCDIVLTRHKEELIKREQVKLGDKEIELAATMTIIPCAYLPILGVSAALVAMELHILSENPELKEGDFTLKFGWGDHMLTEYPSDERILFISPNGCTLGEPSTW